MELRCAKNCNISVIEELMMKDTQDSLDQLNTQSSSENRDQKYTDLNSGFHCTYDDMSLKIRIHNDSGEATLVHVNHRTEPR